MSRAMRHLCIYVALVSTAPYVLMCSADVAAQEPPAEPPKTDQPAEKTPGDTTGVGKIREVKPDVFYFLDKHGRLVPVVGVTLERIRDLLAGTAKVEPPRYAFTSSSISGSVVNDNVELKLNLEIELNVDGLVGIPLRLNNAILRNATYRGTGKQYMQFDPEAGNSCWIRDRKGTKHKLELDVVAPIEKTGNLSRVSFFLPLDSKINITLSTERVRVVEHKNAPQLNQFVIDGHTELELYGKGNVQLAWRPDRAPGQEPVTILTADGTVTVTFVGQRHVISKAVLTVSSHNGPIDTFVVRLPKGMKHVPFLLPTGSEYEVHVLSDKDKKQRNLVSRYASDELVEVRRLKGNPEEPLEIELRGRLSGNSEGNDEPLGSPVQAAGFEILEAERQEVTIDIISKGDWSLRYEPSKEVQRRKVPKDSRENEDVVARFQYSKRSSSLKVRVETKTTRVSVEPLYVVTVGEQEARLEARFEYELSGANNYPLKIDLGAWQIDEILPQNLDPSEDGKTRRKSPLTIQLSPTNDGKTELKILAHLEILTDSEQFSFDLPRPQSNSLSQATFSLLPATLVIVPENNVDLTPVEAELKGLVVDSTPSTHKDLPASQQPTLFYSKQADDNAPTFVGRIEILSRRVSVEVDSLADIDPKTVRILQRFNYRIDYEAAANLELDVPLTVDVGNLRVTLGDKDDNGDAADTTLPVTVIEEEEITSGEPAAEKTDGEGDAPPTVPKRRRLRVDLPEKHRLGDVELVIQYELRLPELKAEEQKSLNFPLVMPWDNDETTVKKNSLRVTATDKLEIKEIESDWKFPQGDEAVAPLPRRLELTTDGARGEFPLQVTLVPSSQPRSTVVRQAWIQTWLTGSRRRDRAVFQLSSSENRLQVQLPRGVQSDDIDVALNGRRVVDFSIGEGRNLAFDIPNNAPQKQHVLELWYTFSETRRKPGSLSLQAPRIVGASWTRRWYWQLVLPKSEHLVVEPGRLTSELTWRRQGIYWGRRSTLEQKDLERWIGASTQAALPEATNQYLFSSFGSVEEVKLFTASRRNLLLAASLIALVAGLSLIYFPALRNPGVLFSAALVLLAVGLYYPEPALQIAQAASVGIVLVLAARLVDWSITRSYASRSVVRGTSLTHIELSPSDSQLPRPENISQISTATAPHAAVAPPSDSNS